MTFGGSFGRATKVRAPADGKSDIDVFVVLDPSHRSAYGMWGKNPVDLLADIKATLIKTLTTPSVRRDAPAVRINYSDMVIDVVPAFARLDGRLDIPMGTGWLVASPVQQAARFTSRNAACSNNFKPLVKMGKYWLSQRVSLPMRSYHFECLAYESFEGRGIESIRDSVPYLFEQLAWRVEYFVHDPGGSGTDVAAYMSGTARANAAGMFRRAGESANAAIATPTMEAEISAWRSLFGPRFPRYG